MVQDPVFPCPACGSLLTSEASYPGTWECRSCACLFPVVQERGWQARLVPGRCDPGPVTLP